jgi:phosphatidylinositol-3-phosphatase
MPTRTRRIPLVLFVMAASAAVQAPPAGASASRTSAGAGAPPIVLILMENHEYGSIVGSPSASYLNHTLVTNGTLATNFHSNFHPSLPDYLALTSGSNDGCTSDLCATRSVTADNLFHQLGSSGWKAYEQAMPSPCHRSSGGNYAARHNPAVYYTDIQAACAKEDVGYGVLAKDLSNRKLRPFSFVTPSLCNDMHDCSVSTGARWLSRNVPPLLSYGAIVIVVWDEGSTNARGGGHVACIEIGPGVTAGSKVRAALTHYSVLAGIEDALGLPRLRHAKGATALPVP